MSKPDINCLGIAGELTLHEKALRKAQAEIDSLRAENARLREELRQAMARRELDKFHDKLREALGRDANDPAGFASKAITDSFSGLPPPPPHHSTVGLGKQDVKG